MLRNTLMQYSLPLRLLSFKSPDLTSQDELSSSDFPTEATVIKSYIANVAFLISTLRC
jgi:hypothetical protein